MHVAKAGDGIVFAALVLIQLPEYAAQLVQILRDTPEENVMAARCCCCAAAAAAAADEGPVRPE